MISFYENMIDVILYIIGIDMLLFYSLPSLYILPWAAAGVPLCQIYLICPAVSSNPALCIYFSIFLYSPSLYKNAQGNPLTNIANWFPPKTYFIFILNYSLIYIFCFIRYILKKVKIRIMLMFYPICTSNPHHSSGKFSKFTILI